MIAVLLAVTLGIYLPEVDSRIDGSLPSWSNTLLFSGGADAARSVLSAISGSLITVTSLTFSLTVVTLQLASSQFSPRLLRTFTRDRFVHYTLALFLATFSFSLTVLRTVRNGQAEQQPFVPQVSVTTSYLLAVASVLGLVLMLAHLAREIRVETVLRNVREDSNRTIEALLPVLDTRTAQLQPIPPTPPDGVIHLQTRASGFVVSIDEDGLVEAATEAGMVIVIYAKPGTSVVAGTPVGIAWQMDGVSRDPAGAGRFTRRVENSVVVGFERTESQDIAFGLRQLEDVIAKALSPGINDPTTAVHALGHVSALMCELGRRDLRPRILENRDLVRVVLARPDFTELLELAVEQPRRYGASDPTVLARLFQLLQEVAWVVSTTEQRAAVSSQLHRLRKTTERQQFDDEERDRFAANGDGVERALKGLWTPAL